MNKTDVAETPSPAKADSDTTEAVGREILDEQTRAVVERLERDPFLDLEMSPPEMRQAFDRFYADIGYPALDVASVTDRDVPGSAAPIAVRIYQPQREAGEALPVLLFFHGGGMMMGSLDAYDGLCRRLAHQSGCIVVSGSYRLAPENKFPAAADDAFQTAEWVHENAASFGGDPDKMAIGGESGGGNLAAGVTQRLRNQGSSYLKFQLLINPAIGQRGASESMTKYARGFFFEPEMLDWFYSQYLADMKDLEDPLVSPVWADSFAGLPPAFIIVAGVDILRSDIERYAAFLKEAGVPVETSTYETTIHGFTVMGGLIDVGVQALDECAAKLAQAFQ